jgi:hypothetical protein
MPIISAFFGIIIKMYYREHNPPHFHAYYQGFEAMFDIRNSQKMAGKLPPKAEKIVIEWSRAHRDELLQNWHNTTNSKMLKKIPGADQ